MRIDDPNLIRLTAAVGSTCSECFGTIREGEDAVLVLLPEHWLREQGEHELPPGWHAFHTGASAAPCEEKVRKNRLQLLARENAPPPDPVSSQAEFLLRSFPENVLAFAASSLGFVRAHVFCSECHARFSADHPYVGGGPKGPLCGSCF